MMGGRTTIEEMMVRWMRLVMKLLAAAVAGGGG